MSEVAENTKKSTVVNQVQKRIRMELWDIVKFQIAMYCHINKIQLSNYDVECISFLALQGNVELTVFCTEAIKQNIFSSTQSVRNALAKIEKKGLIIKTGKSKKRISINPDLNIQVIGNILLEYKVIRIDPAEG